MKLRWTIAFGLLVVAIVCGVLLLPSASREQKTLEETQRALRQQGFKIDLSEFDFSTSPELRARAAAITNSELKETVTSEHARLMALREEQPDFMTVIGPNSALVVWKEAKVSGLSGENLWPALRAIFEENSVTFDAACEAALSGPIRFNLNASHGSGMLLQHLSVLKILTQNLGKRAVLELHDGKNDAAWTNLMAATRLVTAYEPEAVEMSHLVRFVSATITFNIAWQVLQAGSWTDERLAWLQREWESVDFFKSLPETPSFTRASMVSACRLDRQQPLASEMALKKMIRSPREAWSEIKWCWQQTRYRHYGSYEDEKNLLLYYRDREVELRRALSAQTWVEMRQLPGVTNVTPFQSQFSSRWRPLINSRELGLRFSGRGRTLLAQAAEAEAHRRLTITAIALERYRLRHGSFPGTLQELAPAQLKEAPVDFIDGQSLRYRLTSSGRFVLYSLGLDGIDDGGKIQRPSRRGYPYGDAPTFGIAQNVDLVWPQPASDSEITAFRRAEEEAKKEAIRRAEQTSAEEEKQREVSRRNRVEQLLATKPLPREREPTFKGRPLSNVLRNPNIPTASRLTLDELLTLKQIKTAGSSSTVTFEMPISYDVMTNIGELRLLVDPELGENPSSDGGERQKCVRGTNGNYLLTWDTMYDEPGQHALQAQIYCSEEKNDGEEIEVEGPVMPYFSSNLFQLDSFEVFSDRGAYLYAKLAEPNGTYTIELKSPTGEHIRILHGSTTNGEIKITWDLIDDRGQRYTNESFQATFSITLTDSGRSVTNK